MLFSSYFGKYSNISYSLEEKSKNFEEFINKESISVYSEELKYGILTNFFQKENINPINSKKDIIHHNNKNDMNDCKSNKESFNLVSSFDSNKENINFNNSFSNKLKNDNVYNAKINKKKSKKYTHNSNNYYSNYYNTGVKKTQH